MAGKAQMFAEPSSISANGETCSGHQYTLRRNIEDGSNERPCIGYSHCGASDFLLVDNSDQIRMHSHSVNRSRLFSIINAELL